MSRASSVALIAGLLLIAAPGFLCAVTPGATWSGSFSTGLATYTQSYSLATEDTTETVSEAVALLTVTGRSDRYVRHRWYLRPELSFGTDLARQRLNVDYRFQPDTRHPRLRLEGLFLGRQYRGGTEYSLSSGSRESRATLRLYANSGGDHIGEMRLLAGCLRYDTPSRLEADCDRRGLRLFLRSAGLAERRFVLGAGLERRSYPDSSAIDRTIYSCEGEYDARDLSAGGLFLRHSSEYRYVRDEDAKPSAWAHYSEISWTRPGDRGRIEAEMTSEIWRYSSTSTTYFDSWRLTGFAGLALGDPLCVAWKLGPAVEFLTAGEQTESFSQYGLRAGLDSWASRFDCSLSIEYGRRRYSAVKSSQSSLIGTLDTDGDIFLYSDFNYWEIWLMASLALTDRINCDLMADYQPEKHTEEMDDSTVSFVDLRLVVAF